ncbi:aspartyl-tRNA(Asn)/glutamyl-tRNA(Gln) amidotransferase subunit A [Microbacterium foliorum]|uniref:amidase n=1 Tax=Microbacterium foliorum TaxID=104336 RepID=UPI0020A0630D|nr:amidase [Microbacterium foliorum]MCP1428198.1 aspartyl-tRNA(Asn)/glutamyl-tRNA(Gln) amidotransferase subunit A [Microbacterium foliorum]
MNAVDLRSSIPDLAAALRAGSSISPADLVEQSLAAIEGNAALRAFVSVDAERARADAETAAGELASGRDRGVLHGLPIAVKDNMDVVGEHTRVGSLLFGDEPATSDATVVELLREAGAIIVGRTNMHELAWGGTTDNPHTGRARNPWNPDHTPAGSSGGAGIAVASGMVVAALGTDTGGSIRLPASATGVSGLRPTLGRVSGAGVTPAAWTMDTVGPLTVRAADAALVHDVIAGWDPRDRVTRGSLPATSTAPAFADGDGARAALSGLRVGVIENFTFESCQPAVSRGVRDALGVLEAAGASLRSIAVPGAEHLLDATIVINSVEPSAMHIDLLANRPADYGDEVRTYFEIGMMFSAVEYVQAQRYRAWFREQLLHAMSDVDVLITPTIPFTAPRHGETHMDVEGGVLSITAGNMKYTAIGSMTGFPSLSIPVGFDSQHLPIGALITARAGDEATAVRVGHAFQLLTEFHEARPPQLDLSAFDRASTTRKV